MDNINQYLNALNESSSSLQSGLEMGQEKEQGLDRMKEALGPVFDTMLAEGLREGFTNIVSGAKSSLLPIAKNKVGSLIGEDNANALLSGDLGTMTNQLTSQLQGSGEGVLGQLQGQARSLFGEAQGQGEGILGQLQGSGEGILGQLKGQLGGEGEGILGQARSLFGQAQGEGDLLSQATSRISGLDIQPQDLLSQGEGLLSRGISRISGLQTQGEGLMSQLQAGVNQARGTTQGLLQDAQATATKIRGLGDVKIASENPISSLSDVLQADPLMSNLQSQASSLLSSATSQVESRVGGLLSQAPEQSQGFLSTMFNTLKSKVQGIKQQLPQPPEQLNIQQASPFDNGNTLEGSARDDWFDILEGRATSAPNLDASTYADALNARLSAVKSGIAQALPDEQYLTSTVKDASQAVQSLSQRITGNIPDISGATSNNLADILMGRRPVISESLQAQLPDIPQEETPTQGPPPPPPPPKPAMPAEPAQETAPETITPETALTESIMPKVEGSTIPTESLTPSIAKTGETIGSDIGEKIAPELATTTGEIGADVSELPGVGEILGPAMFLVSAITGIASLFEKHPAMPAPLNPSSQFL